MNCCNPAGHIVDSRFYADGYSTPESKRVFCDLYRYQRWLDVEAALARAQASLGMIPQEAGELITESADLRKLDLKSVREGLKVTSHSLMPLLKAMAGECAHGAGRFIHFGATTQDIEDTAQVLEIRDILDIVSRDLSMLVLNVARLAEKYSSLITIGRTHAQHALPMTLGLRMAVWLDELLRHVERLKELRPRVLVSQLFGGVGTMDPFGEKGFELLDIFSAGLGLRSPATAWHASRDRIAEFLNTMALIAGTLARIADEIRTLSRSETGEMEEPFHMGKIGSSTMPHKRNPELCEQAVVLARLIKTSAISGMDGLINEHERDYRAVRLEWVSITDSSLYMCGLLAMMKHITEHLVVHEDRVLENARDAAPFICTEALMFFLGTKLGKDRAHTLIYDAYMKAVETGEPPLDILMKQDEINAVFSRTAVENILHPDNHTGMSEGLVARTVGLAMECLEGFDPAGISERSCPLSSAGCDCSVVHEAIF